MEVEGSEEAKMSPGEGVIGRARQTVDGAIDLIRREVRIQREKSNSMCKLKTAHNWEAEVEVSAATEEADGNSYFMKAHTITVLIFLISCLIYVAMFEDPAKDAKESVPVHEITSFNTKRGLVAALSFWVALGMTIMPDGPFSRYFHHNTY